MIPWHLGPGGVKFIEAERRKEAGAGAEGGEWDWLEEMETFWR